MLLSDMHMLMQKQLRTLGPDSTQNAHTVQGPAFRHMRRGIECMIGITSNAPWRVDP